MAAEQTARFTYQGHLKGHGDWVTCLATSAANPNLLVSGSRDKTLITWELTREQGNYGIAKRSLKGHSHFISDVAISSDGQWAVSGSWDKTLRLWELNTGVSKAFVDHQKDVMSVAFSPDNTKIISGGRDRTIKLWNILGECKYTLTDQGHSDWVSCVRFAPNPKKPVIVTGGWDRLVKVWDLGKWQLQTNLAGHSGVINTVTISPDGSLCASGGKDGVSMLWDLKKGEHLYSLDANDSINALVFHPTRYWLCAATSKSIKIWNLESKQVVAELVPEAKNQKTKAKASCVSLAWSSDGTALFSGYDDGNIRVWGVL